MGEIWIFKPNYYTFPSTHKLPKRLSPKNVPPKLAKSINILPFWKRPTTHATPTIPPELMIFLQYPCIYNKIHDFSRKRGTGILKNLQKYINNNMATSQFFQCPLWGAVIFFPVRKWNLRCFHPWCYSIEGHKIFCNLFWSFIICCPIWFCAMILAGVMNFQKISCNSITIF